MLDYILQVNTLAHTEEQVKLPISRLTIQEWATNLNKNAPEHITYIVKEL